MYFFLLSDKRASPLNHLLHCITSDLFLLLLLFLQRLWAWWKCIFVEWAADLAIGATCRSGRSDLWWGACASSINSTIRFSAFVDTCAFSPVISECIQWSLAVCNSLSNGHCTTRTPIFPRELFVVLRLRHAPADRGRTDGDTPYVWGYRTADLRILSLWLITENMVWPQPVKVKPTRPGTDFLIPWLSLMQIVSLSSSF